MQVRKVLLAMAATVVMTTCQASRPARGCLMVQAPDRTCGALTASTTA